MAESIPNRGAQSICQGSFYGGAIHFLLTGMKRVQVSGIPETWEFLRGLEPAGIFFGAATSRTEPAKALAGLPPNESCDGLDDTHRFRLVGRRGHSMLREAIERVHLDRPAAFAIGRDEALLHFQRMIFVVGLEHHQYRRQIDPLVAVDDRLRAAFGHRFFRPPVVQVGLDELFTVGFLGVAEAIQRVYHRPASNHIRKAGIDLSMVWQRQRRISSMPRSKRTQHDLMAAAGIPERSYSGRSVELGRMRLEPANSQVHITDRSGIARLRWLAEIDSSHQDAPSRQRLIDTGVIRPVAVVPCAAVRVDDARKWSGSFRLINANQPGLACQVLALRS